MTEGTVVMVVGSQDSRVREVSNEPMYGTVIQVLKDEVVVLLPDGVIWQGLKRDVVVQ